MIIDIEGIGPNGPSGVRHRLWMSEPKARTKTKVVARCDHSDAEGVLAILAGDHLRCDWTAEILEQLVRHRIPLEETRAWAALPINPNKVWKHHRHAARTWSLTDVYLWHAEHLTPSDAALRHILPRTQRRSG